MSGIVTGDDVALPVTLKKDNTTFTINPAADVKASIISLDRATVLIASTAVSNAAAGADWANSLVVVEFSSAETGAITAYDPALLEIQVDDGGKLTWFVNLDIVKGTIV